MARTGSRSRKCKFHGNQHTQRSPKSAKIEKPIGENANIESASEGKIKGKHEVKEEKKRNTRPQSDWISSNGCGDLG